MIKKLYSDEEINFMREKYGESIQNGDSDTANKIALLIYKATEQKHGSGKVIDVEGHVVNNGIINGISYPEIVKYQPQQYQQREDFKQQFQKQNKSSFEEERFRHYTEDENINPNTAKKMAEADVKQERIRLENTEKTHIKHTSENNPDDNGDYNEVFDDRGRIKISESEDNESEEPDETINIKHRKSESNSKEEILPTESEEPDIDHNETIDKILGGISHGYESFKPSSKSSQQLSREQELEELRLEHQHKERLAKIESGYRPEHEPSFRDLGKGSMQTEKYEVSKPPSTHYKSITPDFFGNSNQFSSTPRNLLGSSISSKRRLPPSTSIPSVKGRKPPNTKIIISKTHNSLVPDFFGTSNPLGNPINQNRSNQPSVIIPHNKSKIPSVKIQSNIINTNSSLTNFGGFGNPSVGSLFGNISNHIKSTNPSIHIPNTRSKSPVKLKDSKKNKYLKNVTSKPKNFMNELKL